MNLSDADVSAPERTPHESLWRSLATLRGNPRAAVWTEPLWGLSMALVMPLLSLYMLAVGLQDAQIGLLATINMVAQVFFGLAGGIITDKLGRRVTTAVFDVVAWVIPSILWAVSQNFWFFLAASVINGATQVTANSWDCLMVEDAERGKLTRIYSLVRVAADCSALFAPIAAVLVSRLGMEHAGRILMVNAAVVMTIKIIWLYFWSTETARGRIRMAETRNESFITLLGGYRGALRGVLQSRGRVLALVIAALVAAVFLVNTFFWPVIVTERVGVPEEVVPFFQMVRSLLSMAFFFTIIPRLTTTVDLKRPVLLGFSVYLVGQLVLLAVPEYYGGISPNTFVLLGVCLLLDSFGTGMLFMLSESLMALHVDQAERSRVMALQRVTIMLAAAPFGWIAGWLSGMNRTYPFLLTAALLVTGLALTATRWVPPRHDTDAEISKETDLFATT
ncbi:MAG: MFS transporter [Promicromonosporaceae bacterium]|nr:MFS transporter [Promicromonosporaceae bacterium]